MKSAEMSVSSAILRRKSCRRFHRDRVVKESVLREIVEKARFAPSGGNMQPWNLYVIGGNVRDDISKAVREKLENGIFGEEPEYSIYPPRNVTPASFMNRRRKLGYEMYRLLGVDRKDKIGRFEAMAENWDFFGAPVGIIVTTSRVLDSNGWGHVGCLLQNICLLAEERGLATCLQEAWASWPRLLSERLEIPPDQIVWCGIAIGYEDESAPVNKLRSERESLDSFSRFLGFPSRL